MMSLVIYAMAAELLSAQCIGPVRLAMDVATGGWKLEIEEMAIAGSQDGPIASWGPQAEVMDIGSLQHLDSFALVLRPQDIGASDSDRELLLNCAFDAFLRGEPEEDRDFSFTCLSTGQDTYSLPGKGEQVYPYVVELSGHFDEDTGIEDRIVSFSEAALTIRLAGPCQGASCQVESPAMPVGMLLQSFTASGQWAKCLQGSAFCPN